MANQSTTAGSLWSKKRVSGDRPAVKTFHHPQVGTLRRATESAGRGRRLAVSLV
ncbi:hypothetical protein [Streptomyces sp. NBC_00094]|uniref:hypothetical protein n=1 Tax=Streptomyces sp. NBC_00094 TaxID=2903620 RepID=UPI002252E12B|nr:hypothetical protein [Streptomyces sp. NBC_00094]MCX5395245.1 hypothetical protein [Streptomyces sp. NBC_00094]